MVILVWFIHPCCWYVSFVHAHSYYESMGIVAQWVNYRQMNNVSFFYYDHCKAHILITVSVVYPWGSGLTFVYPLLDLWWVSSRDIHTCITVRWVLSVFWHDSFFWTYLWHLDTSQLEWFWRGEHSRCWPLVVLCFCVLSVSVDKLEAELMLCVDIGQESAYTCKL